MSVEGYKYTCHQCFHKEKNPKVNIRIIPFHQESGHHIVVWSLHHLLTWHHTPSIYLNSSFNPKPIVWSAVGLKLNSSTRGRAVGPAWAGYLHLECELYVFLGSRLGCWQCWFWNAELRTKMIKTIPVKTNSTKARPKKEVQQYTENSSCHMVSGTLSLKVDFRSFETVQRSRGNDCFPLSFSGWNGFLKLWLKDSFTLSPFLVCFEFGQQQRSSPGLKVLLCASYQSKKRCLITWLGRCDFLFDIARQLKGNPSEPTQDNDYCECRCDTSLTNICCCSQVCVRKSKHISETLTTNPCTPDLYLSVARP